MSISSLLFIIIFLILSYLCLTRSAAYGIFLYEFVYFIFPPARWWYGQIPDLRYAFIVVMLIVLAFLLHRGNFTSNRLSDIPQFKWLGVLTIIVLLSWFWGVDSLYFEKFSIVYIKYLVFVVFLYKVLDSREKLDIAIWVYIAGIFYICFIAWQMGRTGDGRLEGIGVSDGTEANGTAAAVVTAVPMIVYMVLFAAKKWMKFLALVSLTFVLNGLILLNSRGAFLAVVVSVGWFGITIFREKGLSSVKWKLGVGIVVGVLLFIYLADNIFWSRMQTLESVSVETKSVSRVLYWLKTFEMLADYPLGTGVGGYQALSPLYLPAEWLTGGQRAVHSTWFEVLSSFGYQGLFVFLGYLGSTFFLARKVKKYLREKEEQYHVLQLVALESALIGFLVAATFLNRFYAEMLYWLPALIAVFANVYMIKPQREAAVGDKG